MARLGTDQPPIHLDFNKLRTRRLILDMTQATLARLVGVNRGSISDWERGRVAPNAEDLVYLARALGTPMWDLFVVVDGEERVDPTRWVRRWVRR